MTLITTEKLLFLKIKINSLVGREKPPYQYDITIVLVWFFWIELNHILLAGHRQYFTLIITDLKRKIKHTFLLSRVNIKQKNKNQSGCGLTRMTFSPRMKSWLMWRVWTLPYIREPLVWQTSGPWAFSETLCPSCVALTVSDSLDSVLLCPVSRVPWADRFFGFAGWCLPAVSRASCSFVGSSSPALSWSFSFSKSCTEISVTLILINLKLEVLLLIKSIFFKY